MFTQNKLKELVSQAEREETVDGFLEKIALVDEELGKKSYASYLKGNSEMAARMSDLNQRRVEIITNTVTQHIYQALKEVSVDALADPKNYEASVETNRAKGMEELNEVFLPMYIQNHILSIENMEMRTMAIEQWIFAAQECMENNNFMVAKSIYAALSQDKINRLIEQDGRYVALSDKASNALTSLSKFFKSEGAVSDLVNKTEAPLLFSVSPFAAAARKVGGAIENGELRILAINEQISKLNEDIEKNKTDKRDVKALEGEKEAKVNEIAKIRKQNDEAMKAHKEECDKMFKSQMIDRDYGSKIDQSKVSNNLQTQIFGSTKIDNYVTACRHFSAARTEVTKHEGRLSFAKDDLKKLEIQKQAMLEGNGADTESKKQALADVENKIKGQSEKIAKINNDLKNAYEKTNQLKEAKEAFENEQQQKTQNYRKRGEEIKVSKYTTSGVNLNKEKKKETPKAEVQSNRKRSTSVPVQKLPENKPVERRSRINRMSAVILNRSGKPSNAEKPDSEQKISAKVSEESKADVRTADTKVEAMAAVKAETKVEAKTEAIVAKAPTEASKKSYRRRTRPPQASSGSSSTATEKLSTVTTTQPESLQAPPMESKLEAAPKQGTKPEPLQAPMAAGAQEVPMAKPEGSPLPKQGITKPEPLQAPMVAGAQEVPMAKPDGAPLPKQGITKPEPLQAPMAAGAQEVPMAKPEGSPLPKQGITKPEPLQAPMAAGAEQISNLESVPRQTMATAPEALSAPSAVAGAEMISSASARPPAINTQAVPSQSTKPQPQANPKLDLKQQYVSKVGVDDLYMAYKIFCLEKGIQPGNRVTESRRSKENLFKSKLVLKLTFDDPAMAQEFVGKVLNDKKIQTMAEVRQERLQQAENKRNEVAHRA